MAPPNVDNMYTLKVDNVPFDIGSDELREVFSKYEAKRDAEDAIEGMEGKDFQGRDLRVQFAKQRRPDNPREFYSRAGDDDRSGGFGDERRGGGYEDDRRGGGGGGDRYGGAGRDRRDERRDDYRRSRSPARRERRHSRSRSPRRDERRDDRRDHGRSSGRERSRSRHRSRSPPRRD
ncbi:hypothetical protein PybrP1_009230 [[Pythium] brassicae (nom. inval.)]|nr:hypothetical protein PybrP1_009230 [[Pythium] brassicae (nom. inval.)]